MDDELPCVAAPENMRASRRSILAWYQMLTVKSLVWSSQVATLKGVYRAYQTYRLLST